MLILKKKDLSRCMLLDIVDLNERKYAHSQFRTHGNFKTALTQAEAIETFPADVSLPRTTRL